MIFAKRCVSIIAFVWLMFLPKLQLAAEEEKLILTLDDCIAKALAGSPSLHASLMQTEDARARLSESYTAYLPSVSASFAYASLSETDPFSITLQTPMGPVTQEITKSITNSYSFNLSLKQPLFTGFRIRNNSGKAADAYDASIAEYNRTRNELLVSVKKNYWTLVKALDAQKVINENLTVVTAYLNDITNYFDQGLSTKNEVLKARIRLSKVKVAKLEADNNVELAQLQLSVTMGKSESRPIYPLSVEYHESRNTDIEEGTLERALRMRFEKKALDAQIKAVEKDVSLSYSAWYPSVYVVGNLAYAQPNQRYFPPVEELKLSWDVGIFAGIDIAAWYSAAFRTEGASARLAMLADNAMQVDNGIAFDVTRALLNRNKAIEQVAVSTLILEQAEENCKIVSENYETGIAILSEALDAELQKNQAVLDLSIAKADYEIALIELDRATGAELIAGREGK